MNNNCGVGATCINVDGHPMCLCREGLVGDGIVCVSPSKTASYELHPSAHGLARGNNDGCFPEGNVWPNFVKEKDLPPYPGGVAPYAATSCGITVCKPDGFVMKRDISALNPQERTCAKVIVTLKINVIKLGVASLKTGSAKRSQNTRLQDAQCRSIRRKSTPAMMLRAVATGHVEDSQMTEASAESRLAKLETVVPDALKRLWKMSMA